MHISGTRNFDLAREKIIRWLTLCFLFPPFYFGFLGIQSALMTSMSVSDMLLELIIMIVPFPIQILFMMMYPRLARRRRSIGLVLNYISLSLGAAFTAFAVYFFWSMPSWG
jgi:hypothetical protein